MHNPSAIPTQDVINNYFVYHRLEPWVDSISDSCTILVHATIIDKVIKALHNDGLIADPEIFEYSLQIREVCFDMRIISVTRTPTTAIQFDDFIQHSQYSFPWEDNPTLFINVKSFNVLKEFIKKYHLAPYIIKIKEQTGFSVVVGHDIIKVVTFNQNAHRLNIIDQYVAHLRHYRTINQPFYYFTLYAFQWLRPQRIDHFKIPIDDSFYQTCYIIVNHLGYNNGLNIFDLLMLRIALCDYRNPLPSSQVKCEIDFFIKRELSKIVKNEHLDIDQYLVDKNYNHIDFLINYLIYEFQNYFATVTNSTLLFGNGLITPTKFRGSIELVQDASDVLRQIKGRYNVIFTVNGAKYEGMCLSLFLNLLGCSNVDTIHLNTNSTWTSDECEQFNRSISASENKINVYLDGENTANFIDDFVSSLKTITFSKGKMVLYISHNLNDYTIFDNLSGYDIHFRNIKIDNRMLNDFKKCELKSEIIIQNSTFENTLPNWILFYDVREFLRATIYENEGTFEFIFQFIEDYLKKTKTKEFQFDTRTNCFFRVNCSDGNKDVSFDDKTFVLDEVESKLELRDNFSKKIIDLYELKYGRDPNDKSNYDFYQ